MTRRLPSPRATFLTLATLRRSDSLTRRPAANLVSSPPPVHDPRIASIFPFRRNVWQFAQSQRNDTL